MKRILLISTIIIISGCVTPIGDQNKNAKELGIGGAAIGALAGAVIGFQGDHSGGVLRGALIGGALGGAAGVAAGSYMDKQQDEFNRQLMSERNAHNIEIQKLRNDSLKITMNSEVSFERGSSRINYGFENSLNKIADILLKYKNSNISIVGHTDGTGDYVRNNSLSSDRAISVKHYLEDRGVRYSRITASGVGSSQPRATNNTASGRQLNRRVEMLISPSS